MQTGVRGTDSIREISLSQMQFKFKLPTPWQQNDPFSQFPKQGFELFFGSQTEVNPQQAEKC